MMRVQRLFSKKDSRDKKDKSWDSVYGAGVGGALGTSGSIGLYKSTKGIRGFDRDKFVKSYKADRLAHLDSEYTRLTASDNPTDNLAADGVLKEAADIGKEVNKKVKLAKIKRGLAYAGIVALPVAGSVLGSLYGRDNDLRKQRRKAEDAIGDNVAKKLKNLNNDKNK